MAVIVAVIVDVVVVDVVAVVVVPTAVVVVAGVTRLRSNLNGISVAAGCCGAPYCDI